MCPGLGNDVLQGGRAYFCGRDPSGDERVFGSGFKHQIQVGRIKRPF